MNYELALKLKKAGFPQDWSIAKGFYYKDTYYPIGDINTINKWEDNPDGSGFHTASTSGCGCGCCCSGIGKSVLEYVRVPTLEELIEACVKDRNIEFNLSKSKDYEEDPVFWTAWLTGAFNKNEGQGVGSSPTNAVARLWIKLQK